MKNSLLKYCGICMISGVFAFSAFAEDAPAPATDAGATPEAKVASVAERTDCAAISAQIDELVAAGTDATDAELMSLQATHRRDCAKRVSGRQTIGTRTSRAAGGVAAATATSAPAAPVITKTPIQEFNDGLNALCEKLNGAIDAAKSDDARQAEVTEMQELHARACGGAGVDAVDPAEIAEKRAAGLCPNGQAPNKYGCCDGERFTDTGNLEFACCPIDGGECLPPIKK